MRLRDVLPNLAVEIDAALLPIGRGDIVDQLREATVERWEYDEFADTASIFVSAGASPSMRPGSRAETVSIYDELGVMLETDDRGGVCVIEVSGGKDLIERLEAARKSGPSGRR